jgi:hypothetical protein
VKIAFTAAAPDIAAAAQARLTAMSSSPWAVTG